MKLVITAATMLLALTASANTNIVEANDNMLEGIVEEKSMSGLELPEYKIEKPEILKESVALPMSSEETSEEKYYRNWLGEKCIDFGNDKKLYYNWKRDVTYAGIPLFLSSFLIKGQKKAFRSARFTFEKNFKTEIDNYTQIMPYGILVGLKACGYQGRSSWDRLLVSALMSNAFMATAVNATKYSVKEMRPDNSSRNSFPSGHTATAFTAATILHKEYGLTRSPWFSVAGYGLATGTGVMRVLNNRHWISDVVAGAGIGILSTELGYFITDLIYKNNGITRRELNTYSDPDHPSFFDIQMGVDFTHDNIEFEYDDPDALNDKIELGTSTAFGVEGAYFFNKYIGIGGMARVTTTPAKGLNFDDEEKAGLDFINKSLAEYEYINAEGKKAQLPGIYNIYIENGNFLDASLDAGVYGNFPLGGNFTLGAKALIGARLSGGISYKAVNGTPKVAGTVSLIDGTQSNLYWYQNADGSQFMSSPVLNNDLGETNFVLENPTEEYELMKVEGNNCINYVLGLSLSWHYKNNFAWKIFCDFDSAKNKYNYKAKLFSDEAVNLMSKAINPSTGQTFVAENPEIYEFAKGTYNGHANKWLNFLTIGAAFSISF